MKAHSEKCWWQDRSRLSHGRQEAECIACGEQLNSNLMHRHLKTKHNVLERQFAFYNKLEKCIACSAVLAKSKLREHLTHVHGTPEHLILYNTSSV